MATKSVNDLLWFSKSQLAFHHSG